MIKGRNLCLSSVIQKYNNGINILCSGEHVLSKKRSLMMKYVLISSNIIDNLNNLQQSPYNYLTT